MATENEQIDDKQTEQNGEADKGQQQQDPKAAAAAKVEAERLETEKKAADAEAEREAEIEKRAAAKAAKLAEKLANEKIAAKDDAAKKAAEREKMDAVEKAKLEAKESADKLTALEARLAAAELKGEISAQLVTRSLAPANPAALGYIQAAVQRELDAGADDVEKALTKVHKAEPFLFAQPQQISDKAAKPTGAKPNTGGAPGGPGERQVQDQSGGRREFTTKAPGEIDPANTAELNRAIQERHGFTIN